MEHQQLPRKKAHTHGSSSARRVVVEVESCQAPSSRRPWCWRTSSRFSSDRERSSFLNTQPTPRPDDSHAPTTRTLSLPHSRHVVAPSSVRSTKSWRTTSPPRLLSALQDAASSAILPPTTSVASATRRKCEPQSLQPLLRPPRPPPRPPHRRPSWPSRPSNRPPQSLQSLQSPPQRSCRRPLTTPRTLLALPRSQSRSP